MPTWTEPAIDYVREKAAEGCSTREISEGLAALGLNFSRAAVIGIAYRKGIQLRTENMKTKAINKGKQPRPKQAPPHPSKTTRARIDEMIATAAAEVKAGHQPLAESRPVTLLELENNQCHWPLDCDADGHRLFCGAKKFVGPYCLNHYAKSLYSNCKETTSNGKEEGRRPGPGTQQPERA
jgi:GcrA cell cycle regulator